MLNLKSALGRVQGFMHITKNCGRLAVVLDISSKSL